MNISKKDSTRLGASVSKIIMEVPIFEFSESDRGSFCEKTLPTLFPQFKADPNYVITSEDLNVIKENLARDAIEMEGYKNVDRLRFNRLQSNTHSVPEYVKRMGILALYSSVIEDLLNTAHVLMHRGLPLTLQTILEHRSYMDYL